MSLFQSPGDLTPKDGSALSSNTTSDSTGVAAAPRANVELNQTAVHAVDGTSPANQIQSEAPAVDITAAFSNLQLSDKATDPDVDTCLAHLKLLTAFHRMEEEVGYTDGLWDIWNTRADISDITVSNTPPAVAGLVETAVANPAGRTTDQKMSVLSKLREKRWALFVARAVERYEAWWWYPTPTLTQSSMRIPLDASYASFPVGGDGMDWTPSMLPPLGK
jgi:hypothetical protein